MEAILATLLQNPEHMFAAVGAVTTFATLLSPALHWIAERTATPYDDEAVKVIDRLISLSVRLGWHKPKR